MSQLTTKQIEAFQRLRSVKPGLILQHDYNDKTGGQMYNNWIRHLSPDGSINVTLQHLNELLGANIPKEHSVIRVEKMPNGSIEVFYANNLVIDRAVFPSRF